MGSVNSILSQYGSSSSSSSSLLNMLNNGRSSAANSILSANITANRERINKIISQATGISNINKTDTSKYEAVYNSAQNTKKYLDALSDDELYDEEKNTIDGIVTAFVDYYNKTVSNMDALGGTIESTYGTKLDTLSDKQKDALAAVGITVEKDGTLKLDKDALSKVDNDKIKAAFKESSSFGQSANSILKDTSEIIKQALLIRSAQTANYGSSGSYLNQLISSVVNTTA